MDSKFPEYVSNKESLSFDELESLSQKCSKQVLYWAQEDPDYFETKKEEVYQCKTQTDYYGSKLLRDVIKVDRKE